MKDLIIMPTRRTPEIIFKANGDLLLNGSSFPEDVPYFFQPIFEWLEEFRSTAPPKVFLTIDADYLNTRSTRDVLKILDILKSLPSSEIIIEWVFEEEDEDMFEHGQILQEVSKLPFVFVEKALV